MKRLWFATTVLLAAVACSAGEKPLQPPTKPAESETPIAKMPENFRVTLMADDGRFAHGVALSADAKRALVGSAEETSDPPHGSVTLWDLTDPRRPRSSPLIPDRGGTDFHVALSGDGKHAATFDVTGKVTLWDLTDPAQPTSRTLAAKGVRTLAFNQDAGYAISGGDKGVHLWDLRDPDRPRKSLLLAQGKYMNFTFRVAMSADGRRALVSDSNDSGDGGVTIWNLSDPDNPEEYVLLRNKSYYSANTIALSGDGQRALVGFHHLTTYNNFLTYWDLRTWDKTELTPMTGWKITPDTVGSVDRWEVSLDHDGRKALVTKYNDADVQLWGLDDLSRFRRFTLSG
jgi:WD40 repeat protein